MIKYNKFKLIVSVEISHAAHVVETSGLGLRIHDNILVPKWNSFNLILSIARVVFPGHLLHCIELNSRLTLSGSVLLRCLLSWDAAEVGWPHIDGELTIFSI